MCPHDDVKTICLPKENEKERRPTERKSYDAAATWPAKIYILILEIKIDKSQVDIKLFIKIISRKRERKRIGDSMKQKSSYKRGCMNSENINLN